MFKIYQRFANNPSVLQATAKTQPAIRINPSQRQSSQGHNQSHGPNPQSQSQHNTQAQAQQPTIQGNAAPHGRSANLHRTSQIGHPAQPRQTSHHPQHQKRQIRHRPQQKNNPPDSILSKLLPPSLYNPESKKILGFLTAEDLLLVALIFLFLDSDEEGSNLMVLALAFVLLSDYVDLSRFSL